MTKNKGILVAAVAAFSMGLAGSASALDVEKRMESAASADKVWAAIGDFCGISDWHPAVAKCEQSDTSGKTIRTLTLQDGATITEELVKWDKAGMSYTYKILESPLPVANYESTLSVSEGNSSAVNWSSSFEAKGTSDDEAKGVIEGIYTSGLESLLKKVGN